MPPFSALKILPSELIERLDALGFSTMTPVQAEAIVPILAGRDVIVQSKTGSGKTLAFGIACVVAADAAKREPETLIITPTRELAEQVATQLRSLAAYRPNLKIVTLYGGVPLRAQAESIAKGVQIVIGTPGRLVDHLGKETLRLGAIRRLVLDEGDRMLEMGFGEEIERIASHMSDTRQTLLFSATFPESIETLGARLLRDPLRIAVDTAPPAKIEEMYCEAKEKRKVLDRLIGHYAPQSLLVFCNTKADTMELAKSLARQGHSVTELHGDLDQRQRQEAVIAFSNGSRRILVATDVASRGLDITGIELVINYDLPHDEAVYTHRIGRTGRADAMGRAISLVSPYETRKREAVAPHAKHKRIEQGQAKQEILLSQRETLCINGGKRQKLRPGDIVGTLAKAIGIDGKQIGDITVTETISYVALERDVIDRARRGVSAHRIKKKQYSAWTLTQ